ncbi:MAG: GIY-YIG nuclease family protein [Chitinophagaceae bacterium]|nr:GIY-YIG nuclease family protein [Chitinophagaceae bacterium]
MPFVIYALVSKKRNWIYVGMSDEVMNRFNRHSQGWEKTTAPYRPFKLMLLACSLTRVDARGIEKWYKTGHGKSVIRKLIQDGYPFTVE